MNRAAGDGRQGQGGEEQCTSAFIDLCIYVCVRVCVCVFIYTY